jgi:peptidyl-prolyl cis-trans isomerase B (cyclophilin B)
MTMKQFEKLPLLALFGVTLCAGCTSPAAQNETATKSDPASVPTIAPVATTSEPTPAPKTYRVADADSLKAQGAPATMVAALKKTQVPPPPMTPVPAKPRVEFKTSKGTFTLELDGKAAPMHVRSFLYLAGRKFYDGTIFHRHADLTGDGKGYIIQGGDPNTKDPKTKSMAGQGGPGYEVPSEAGNGLTHEKLVIAAARTQDPDSAGSQFYITQNPVSFLDDPNSPYTVFGKVVEGKEVALKLTQEDKLLSVKVLKAKN